VLVDQKASRSAMLAQLGAMVESAGSDNAAAPRHRAA
jgi:hypothetical protein